MRPRKTFATKGSPLEGLERPRDWADLDGPAKRRALVAYGHARDYDAACRLMGRHVAAVMRGRRDRMERARQAREDAERRTGE